MATAIRRSFARGQALRPGAQLQHRQTLPACVSGSSPRFPDIEDIAMRPVYGGIDFGTSNSTVGVIENGKPRLVPLERDEVTLPSAIFFNYEDNGIYLGRDGIGQYTDGVEGRLMR